MELRTFRGLVSLATLSLLAFPASADSIDGFAVLGDSTVTNTGLTTVIGNFGIYPGTSIPGFGSIALSGAEDIDNAAAQLAQSDASSLYAADSAPGFLSGAGNLTGVDLGSFGSGGLSPGVYYFSSSAELTGTLLLNAGDNDTASWTFVIGTTLTTASASSVEIINSGAAGSYTGNINWIVETYATLGTTTTFLGDILAEDLVTLNAGATIGCGGAIGLTGAVTLDTNTISTGCTVAGNGDPVEAPSSVPESGTLTLLPSGLLAAIALLAFRKSTLSR